MQKPFRSRAYPENKHHISKDSAYMYYGADQDERDAVTLFDAILILEENGNFPDLIRDMTERLERAFTKVPEKDGVKVIADGWLKYDCHGIIARGNRQKIPAAPFMSKPVEPENDDGQALAKLIRRTVSLGYPKWNGLSTFTEIQMFELITGKTPKRPNLQAAKHAMKTMGILSKLQDMPETDMMPTGKLHDALYDIADKYRLDFHPEAYTQCGRCDAPGGNAINVFGIYYMPDELVRQVAQAFSGTAYDKARVKQILERVKQDTRALPVMPPEALSDMLYRNLCTKQYLDCYARIRDFIRNIGANGYNYLYDFATEIYRSCRDTVKGMLTLQLVHESIRRQAEKSFLETCEHAGILQKNYTIPEDFWYQAALAYDPYVPDDEPTARAQTLYQHKGNFIAYAKEQDRRMVAAKMKELFMEELTKEKPKILEKMKTMPASIETIKEIIKMG